MAAISIAEMIEGILPIKELGPFGEIRRMRHSGRI